ncbi:MAG: heme biosynthesis HemY N-terminal domain-containing protein [Betaproteobacteria bacterium]
MRAALWLLALFAVAVAAALFVGDNEGTVTLFWPPYRIDLSLNLVLVLTLCAFVLLHLALRTLAALFAMPALAQRWRGQQRERSLLSALVDAQLHQYAGRFLRARKAAVAALQQEQALTRSGEVLPDAVRVRALGHVLAAEASHALQDKATREQHLQLALEHSLPRSAQEVREGVQMRAARFALDDRDMHTAWQRLEALPQGAARRTLALRMRLKAARLGGRTGQALDTARLLAKHGAFSESAVRSLVHGLAQELLSAAHDPQQLLRAWSQLDVHEQQHVDVALHAAARLQVLGGDVQQALLWVLALWDRMLQRPLDLSEAQRVKMVQVLESSLQTASQATAVQWLARVESAHTRHPGDADLQYLAARVCVRQQLWGKGQLLLEQCVSRLGDPQLKRSAWRTLALLAEQRGDEASAQTAYRQAAAI